ncbi:MAG: extracellular solute-binding protein [Anaerotruncus sp.]|nr:extracellular solute-binding protein [Anaerotruncus sp.]
MYNKKLVSEAEKPKTWKDVLDPKWKGKVAYADASKSGSSYTLLVTWLTIYGKNEAGWKFVEDLLRQCKVLPKSSMTYQGVANGEYPIGLTFEQAAFDYLKGGAPIGLIYPSEGTAITLDGSAVIKNAPHPTAAKLFLDWTVSKEMQQLMVERFGRRSVRKDVGSPAGLPALDQIKAIAYDLNYAAGRRTEPAEAIPGRPRRDPVGVGIERGNGIEREASARLRPSLPALRRSGSMARVQVQGVVKRFGETAAPAYRRRQSGRPARGCSRWSARAADGKTTLLRRRGRSPGPGLPGASSSTTTGWTTSRPTCAISASSSRATPSSRI